MNESSNQKRKYYPGDVRQTGTKEYSMILGNLINYKHQIVSEKEEQKVAKLMFKIALKIRELGYESEHKSIRKKLGRRKEGKYQDITSKKKNDTIEIAVKVWEDGNQKNEEVKKARKSQA